ncbi:MAG TPA: AMP-binding protein [Amycolatopsis sp.]|uniref:AMP-binding protein n=1 Tax=Amycolatopsis sp. TaxID=37632 RepID=UPI002B47B188|nr:AMP-binding protein [Amycolatopsis sp.]HKS46437.1 AMP-binding protein [Amycolatopsis sp.]
MGRPAFVRFLREGRDGLRGEPGVHWGGQFASWRELSASGRERAALVDEQHAYVVDPSAGLDALVSLFAVAGVADTFLVWAKVNALGIEHRRLANGLYQVPTPFTGLLERPLWGVCTSGTSGAGAKVAVAYADQLELIALHYERAMYQPTFADGAPPLLSTCLPLQFSAAFAMVVLQSLYMCRDLVVFQPHDWRTVADLAKRTNLTVLAVPALAAAAALGGERVDMSKAAFFLGAGHLGAHRIDTIRRRFENVSLINLYGAAEAGAISVDRDPVGDAHVGRPIVGKAVWLHEPDERGIGAVAATGPDCAEYIWQPGEGAWPVGKFMASTDYGHFDEAGHLYLDGRIDNGEKLFGITIYPRAIERHLLRLDGVADAQVRVVRDPNGLERLAVTVIGGASEHAVRAHCEQLPEIERPNQIECVAEKVALGRYSAHGKLR